MCAAREPLTPNAITDDIDAVRAHRRQQGR
jgi:hypothetical protein